MALPTAINTAYLGTSHFKTADRGMFFSVSSNCRTGGKMLWYGMGVQNTLQRLKEGEHKFHTALVVVCLGPELNVHP